MSNTEVKLTMLSGATKYVDIDEFKSLNVSETPKAIISNHIRGSRGPLLKVYDTNELTGDHTYINANFIEEVSITQK